MPPNQIALELYDVNEKASYGMYLGELGTGDKDPTHCEVRGRTCSSEAEWMDLVSPYMDE